jgi:DNA polymerase I-like protein with 3'-5' exonuclease and polymerase domains
MSEKIPYPKDYLILDLETTTQPDGRVRCVDGNDIYMIGLRGRMPMWEGDDSVYVTKSSFTTVFPFKVLVGHNIKFDLEYLQRTKAHGIEVWLDANGRDVVPLMDYLRKHAIVLDTQLITYLHSGHRLAYNSLEEACVYWGIPAKKTINLKEELPKVDYDITKIPGMDDYLANDVDMTTLLINKMLEDEWVIKNFSWILQMHDGLLGCFDIEYNGMHVDPSRLVDLKKSVEKKLRETRDEFNGMIRTWYTKQIAENFDPSSNDDVGTLLFGGTFKWQNRIPNGVYATGAKAGMTKYKIEHKEMELKGYAVGKPEWKSGKTSKWLVSEDILNELVSDFTKSTFPHDFARTMLTYRELSKLDGTYLSGLSKHLRIVDSNYYVFPQINTCITATGRTSSSKPNMQNNPTHDSVGVASIYTSRYKEQGVLVEVDFKQIEVIALAVLSGDKQLEADIRAGRDIHTETGKGVFGHKMTKEERRVVKTINFGLIYGAGAKTLAAQAGVSEAVAKKLVNNFYARYPDVQKYFNAFKKEIQAQMNHRGENNGTWDKGFAQKRVMWQSMTGRRYVFKDYISSYAGKTSDMEVSHTETRNYPIQGLATGDLVLSALGNVWRRILPKYGDDVKLIGLVHDSIRFDVKLDRQAELMGELKCALEDSGNLLNKVIKYDLWNLPIGVSFSEGKNFFDMKELTV